MAWRPPLFENIHLRLGLEPTRLGLKPIWPGIESSQILVWDLIHGILIRITLLVILILLVLVPGLTGRLRCMCLSTEGIQKGKVLDKK